MESCQGETGELALISYDDDKAMRSAKAAVPLQGRMAAMILYAGGWPAKAARECGCDRQRSPFPLISRLSRGIVTSRASYHPPADHPDANTTSLASEDGGSGCGRGAPEMVMSLIVEHIVEHIRLCREVNISVLFCSPPAFQRAQTCNAS